MNTSKVRLPKGVRLYLHQLNNRIDNRLHEEISLNVDIDQKIALNDPVSMGMNTLHMLASSAMHDSLYGGMQSVESQNYRKAETLHLIEVIDVLLDQGADLNAKSVDGETALDYALGSSAQLVDYLLDKGASVDSVDVSGISTLEKARRLNSYVFISDSQLHRIINLKSND